MATALSLAFSGRYSMCGGMTSDRANLDTESVVSYKRNVQTVLCDNTTQGLVSVDVHCKKTTSFLFLITTVSMYSVPWGRHQEKFHNTFSQ